MSGPPDATGQPQGSAAPPAERPFSGCFVSIAKPAGISSAQVVGRLRRATGVGKAGHGGTLDPAASGVLPVCLGTATRLANFLLLGTKAYRVTVRLGSATDTFDGTGRVTQEADPAGVSEDDVAAALPSFTGVIAQRPPAFSAIKRGGKRLYELARKGVVVETEPRLVEVYSITITRWTPPDFDLDVECGHGFYARSLANDIGGVVGRPAHMSALVRTRAGGFTLDGSVSLNEFEERASAGEWSEVSYPLDWPVRHLRDVVLDSVTADMALHGRMLMLDRPGVLPAPLAGEEARAYSQDGRLVALLVYEPETGGWRPDRVLQAV